MAETGPVEVEPRPQDAPIIATYGVTITVRGPKGVQGPTLAQIEHLIEDVIDDQLGLASRARATRTDR